MWIAVGLGLWAGMGSAASVLLISIDGMKPEYVLGTESRNLKIPTLRGLVADGAYADGVTGVWPTITYPSHTTLLTGVAPAVHGITNNLEFDPERHFSGSWFWYAQQIRVPTLWQAAHARGLSTASVGWPVSVGAKDVDFLIPEYWRNFGGATESNPSDRYLIAELSRPPGLLEQMQAGLGPYMMGNDTSSSGDEIKTRFAIDILQRRKPAFMTIHLSSLDDAEHEHGPFSAAANRNLEAIDAMLSRLAQAARANDPDTVVVVVSDHGFASLTHRINLYVPFLKAGWMEVAADADAKSPHITSWRAEPWMAGGMAAIMLHDPGDARTLNEVGTLLRDLQRNPANGIASILDAGEILRVGGFPDASFLVVFQPGFYAGGNMSGDLVTGIAATQDGEMPGGHGFSPQFASMRAAFFAAGSGVARHRDLGLIDMRQIAPTVARLLSVPMPTATATPLELTR